MGCVIGELANFYIDVELLSNLPLERRRVAFLLIDLPAWELPQTGQVHPGLPPSEEKVMALFENRCDDDDHVAFEGV